MHIDKNEKCWICKSNVANSGEHIIKKSDLKSLYPCTNQNNPIYKRRDGVNAKPIGSINSNSFKYKKVICTKCNNSVTQAHDNAWKVLSEYLQSNWQDIKKINGFLLSDIFTLEYKISMIHIQLYLIKLLGCKISESGKDFGLESFSSAILNTTEHPNVYISFRDSENTNANDYSASSNYEVYSDEGNIQYIHWFLTIGSFSVDVIYANNIEDIDLNGAKKPNEINDFVSLSKLNYNQNYK